MTASFHCRSTLKPLPVDGFSPAALRALTGDARRLPARLDFTRAEVIRFRAEAVERFSFSGVQDKVPLRLERGRLIPATESTDYILKPIPGTPLPAFTADVPANEHLTMQLAAQVHGMETAACALLEMADGEPAYLTRRFDRTPEGARDMEDFCALAGRSPDTHGRGFKYDGSYEEMAQLLRRHCPAYAVEAEKLFRQIMFCYAHGNGDAHLKNFSLIRGAGNDPVLSPAYDLVCTHLHLPHETALALDLLANDELTPQYQALGFYSAPDFLLLAQRMNLRPARAQAILAQFTDPKRAAQTEDLVRRSFLSPEARDRYLAIVTDRRKALGHR